jgi:uncharacterized protein
MLMDISIPAGAVPAPTLATPAVQKRIDALDIVRGFAIIGIAIMNVDFFNRSVLGIGGGMPTGLTGLNWLAAWFNAYFVVGKFWTIFSLLFGMGFAVMLQQAEKNNRPFLKTWLRRIIALGVIGSLHHIFIWPGDILFSYAVAALGLSLVLFGSWRVFLCVFLILVGLSFVPNMKAAGDFGFTVAVSALLALYLRHPKVYSRFNFSLSMASWILLLLASGLSIAFLASWFVPAMKDASVPLGIFSTLLSISTWLSIRFYQTPEKRMVRTGVFTYCFFTFVGLGFGMVNFLTPDAPAPTRGRETASASASSSASSSASASAKPVDKQAERKAQQAKRIKERQAEMEKEVKVLTQGSYVEAVKLRTGHFIRHAQGSGGFAVMLIGMFLIGNWFVRAGIMQNPARHLDLLRKLAFIGLPLGIGLGLAGSLLATGVVPGVKNGWQIASGLLSLGNLPACLGYVSVILLLLHRAGEASWLRVLAPFGRMALTNYLLQSLVASMVFYGYGLGYYGMGRAAQFGYVALLIPLQIAFSHWWLSMYRYGPLEWAWRALTYWNLPPMRPGAKVALA